MHNPKARSRACEALRCVHRSRSDREAAAAALHLRTPSPHHARSRGAAQIAAAWRCRSQRRCARRLVAALLFIGAGCHGSADAGQLLDLYHAAQVQDLTLRAAGYQRDAAVEVHPQALSALLPQIDATASVSSNRYHGLDPSKGVDHYPVKSGAVDLSQTLFDWAAFQRLAEASQQVAQAQAQYQAAQQDLIYRVATAYFGVLYADDSLRADVDAENAYAQQLEQAKRKFEVGLAAIADMRNAEAAYDSSAALVIADRRALDSAKRSLAQIVGAPVDTLSALQDDIPLQAPEPASEDDWVRLAQRDNPELLGAFFAAEAARKNVAAVQGEWLPTLAAVGSVSRRDSELRSSGDSITDSIGVQLNWRLFQGGWVASRQREARAVREEATAQYERLRRATDQSTRDAYEGVISGIASVKANKQAVLSNRTSLEATKLGLKVGTRTELDVLAAQQATAAAQRNYYRARYDLLSSLLSLKQTAGHLDEADLAKIDDLLDHGASGGR
jgi:outer membrane protein